MPNRTILFATGLFLVLVVSFIFSSPGRSGKIKSNQDFTINIPPKASDAASIGNTQEVAKVPVVQLSDEEQQQALATLIGQEHITISSNMTSNKKYIAMNFLGVAAYNPSILPHPNQFMQTPRQWVLVAQEAPTDKTGFMREISCFAEFANDTFTCVEPPTTLPIASTVSDKCPKAYETENNIVGPRGARAFFGPLSRPYIMYGSPSAHTCMGQHMQDLSRLLYWQYLDPLPRKQPFFQPVDLQRPGTYNTVEKSWFAFWDRIGDMYIHHSLFPKRSFAKVNTTGGIGDDLALQTAAHDDACMAQYLPKITNQGYEEIEQATGSLLVTLCDREDPTCFETERNTFLLSIVNHKSTYLGQNIYEPYLVLFKRTSPFELHAISKKSLWINGREKPTASGSKSKDQSFRVTSANWKAFGKDYQGYLTDELMISFSIDDQRSGTIDVVVADLVEGLGLCTP
ncbi:hypothetical protein AMS68_001346 [Peltaster fructicola]|uniref:Uncharacterized protein n=1 Tax=Peltaster fructicola TaxID=286661 RepID=A0A6H0XMH5_9PEZI|nr:hypothetical protein AMS68_001346 [Peltaster fructicola]